MHRYKGAEDFLQASIFTREWESEVFYEGRGYLYLVVCLFVFRRYLHSHYWDFPCVYPGLVPPGEKSVIFLFPSFPVFKLRIQPMSNR
jgi:hypothetical protein